MGPFEANIDTAVRNRDIPGVMLYAKDYSDSADQKGNFQYSHILGDNLTNQKPLAADNILTLASVTKLFTTIAALQLVESGILSLDDDVSGKLPALAEKPVLIGFTESGSPIEVPRKNPITLRQLLTHSAGNSYDFLSDAIREWQSFHGIKPTHGSTVEERFGYPLIYEPGKDWAYSSSLDWTGKLIETVTGKSLEQYLRQKVWDPVGASSFTFDVEAVRPQLWAMNTRDGDTGEVILYRGRDLNQGVTDCLGGQGSYGSAPDVMRVLHSLLVDDGKLLSPRMSAEMFKPQLSFEAKKSLLKAMEEPEWAVGHFPVTHEYDWGLGGLLVDGHSHSNRQNGTLMWSGASNIFWWIDRQSGLCGLFVTQMLPAAEDRLRPYIKAFEDEMYARIKEPKARSAL
ncbi:acyltransferase LovD [Colletotrichum spaethianum]|uniref:Acyltransferase LovD n=1 Tax=Colletotrichum spaethianum TaxID=700344 RepID=A0AA37L1Q3_9PEZI|nr:acyltransferase LovD [Colletotrichum spaethianum]GKT40232.1 acyltransferase LovD [Colletotrichum spaethianum]